MTEFINLCGNITIGQVVIFISAMSFLGAILISAIKFIRKVDNKLDEYSKVKKQTDINSADILDINEHMNATRLFQVQIIRNKLYSVYLKTKEDGGITKEDLTEFNLNARIYTEVLGANKKCLHTLCKQCKNNR